MKKYNFERPEAEVVVLNVNDVITESPEEPNILGIKLPIHWF